jgi:hypothetical protein
MDGCKDNVLNWIKISLMERKKIPCGAGGREFGVYKVSAAHGRDVDKYT